MAGISSGSFTEIELPPEKKLKPEDESGTEIELPPEKKLKLEDESGTEIELPPEKKLKLEDEDEDEVMDEDALEEYLIRSGCKLKKYGIDDYDSDDPETGPKKDIYKKYYQQLKDSGGFDFDDYPGGSLYAPIYPIRKPERDPKLVDELKGFASMAIKQWFGYSENDHKVKEIVKVNAGGCKDFTYYITFKVVDDKGNEETYQAKVTDTFDNTIEIPLCKLKA